MLVALHPVPARDFPLGPAFAAAHAAGANTVSVGRVEGNNLSAILLNEGAPQAQRLQDKLVNMVSRRHAELQVVAGQLQLVDLRPVNGSYVNDQRMEGGSRRVLQENDVVSFGGPTTIAIRGQPLPNPWVWRVRQLHEFLAAYVPPSQGLPPTVHVAAAVGTSPGGAPAPSRELYTFSASGPAAGDDCGAEPAAGHPGATSAGGSSGEVDQQPQEAVAEEEVVSPGPAPGGSVSVQLGSIPLQARPASPVNEAGPAAAALAGNQLPEDSVESAELVAVAAVEARLASQQGSAPEPGAVLPAVMLPLDPTQPLRSVAALQQQPAPGDAAQASTAAVAGSDEVQIAALRPETAAAVSMPPEAAGRAERISQRMPQAAPGFAPTFQAEPQAVQQQPPGAAVAEPELIDLTVDSPVSQHAQRPGSGGRAAEFVDLMYDTTSSPTKRRHGVAQQEEHDAKRARPSPDAQLRAPAAAAAETGTSAAAAAAAAVGQDSAAPSTDVSDKLQQEMVCPICQELLVMAHAIVPCGHWFCGECLAGWLGNGRKDCPSCRKKSTAQPLRQHAMDNMAELLAAKLPAEDQEARQERIRSWEQHRERLEQQLAAPWQRGGSARGPVDGAGEGGRLLSALAASILGGGGLGFGANPLMLLDPLAAAGGGGGLGAEMPEWGGGGARTRRTPAVVARHAPPPAPVVPPQFEYRVEVSARHSTLACAACGRSIPELSTRIGARQLGPPRRDAAGGWRWHHLQCLPPAHWREARLRGINNLRGIPPPDQSRVRQHLQLAPR